MTNRMFWAVLALVSGVLISMSLVSCKKLPSGCVEVKMCPSYPCVYMIDGKAYYIDEGRLELFSHFSTNRIPFSESIYLDIEMVKSKKNEVECIINLFIDPYKCLDKNLEKGSWDLVKIEPCQNIE